MRQYICLNFITLQDRSDSMKQSLLAQIGDHVKQFAETMSSVLLLDVDIADQDLLRIAGTGKFALNIDKAFVNEGNAFREVLRTKKSLFIEDASISTICNDCNNLHICKNNCELCCPILFNDEVIGVISISSATPEQKERILKNYSQYNSFLENMASLITARATGYVGYQKISNILDLLYRLLDLINDGVIMLDEDDKITYVNEKTELLLGNTLAQIQYLQKINQLSFRRAEKNDVTEFNFKIKGKVLKLHGEEFSVYVGKDKRNVFIFQDMELKRQKLVQTNTMEEYTFDYLIGTSKNLMSVIKQCNIFAVNNNNLLIYGETGTGKEMFARSIHRNSDKKNKPFVAITCTGAPESELELEMFGDDQDTKDLGKISIAAGGTLFIDEISDLPIRLQGKLMNLIYRGELKCRIIATTNTNLKELVENGGFRENLYYALETFTLQIPPLRFRKEDILPMANNFLKKYNHMEGKEIKFNKELLNAFVNYSWPGNIRELSNVVSYIVNYCSGNSKVGFNDLPSELVSKFTNPIKGNFNLEENEKRLIINALNSYGNSNFSMNQVAKELGISRATLYRKLDKYEIEQNTSFRISSD